MVRAVESCRPSVHILPPTTLNGLHVCLYLMTQLKIAIYIAVPGTFKLLDRFLHSWSVSAVHVRNTLHAPLLTGTIKWRDVSYEDAATLHN